MKNKAESQAVFAVSYVLNIRGRAMLPDSTVDTSYVTMSYMHHLTDMHIMDMILSTP